MRRCCPGCAGSTTSAARRRACGTAPAPPRTARPPPRRPCATGLPARPGCAARWRPGVVAHRAAQRQRLFQVAGRLRVVPVPGGGDAAQTQRVGLAAAVALLPAEGDGLGQRRLGPVVIPHPRRQPARFRQRFCPRPVRPAPRQCAVQPVQALAQQAARGPILPSAPGQAQARFDGVPALVGAVGSAEGQGRAQVVRLGVQRRQGAGLLRAGPERRHPLGQGREIGGVAARQGRPLPRRQALLAELAQRLRAAGSAIRRVPPPRPAATAPGAGSETPRARVSLADRLRRLRACSRPGTRTGG